MKIPHEPVAVQEKFAYITTELMLGKELADDNTKSEDLPKHPYEEPRAPALVQFPLWDNCAFFVRILPDTGGFFMSKNKKAGIIALAILVLLVAGCYTAYRYLTPKATAGDKTIAISIDHLNGEDKTLTINTDADYLRGVLEQEALVEGTDSDFGLFITAIDGEAADESKQQWWGYTKSGEYVETGVDQTVIEDGDSFEFKLNEGY